jgi:hypothetical protein
MRADIHGGPEHNALQSEAGYIDARPQGRLIDESLLQRTAAPYIWVKGGCRRQADGTAGLPSAPEMPCAPGSYACCHNRTSAGLSSGSAATSNWDDFQSSHSATSSALARIVGGIVRPSVFAVLRFTVRLNLRGGSTGRAAGLAPLRIRSTKPAARRNRSP